MNTNASPRSAGTISCKREKLQWPKDKNFRILSIDGGGIKGILPARFLKNLEDYYLQGAPIGRFFDLVTGTSTGGIIALALAKGIKASEIADLYLDKGDKIFPIDTPVNSFIRNVRSLFRPAYDSNPLQTELEHVFGSTAFGQASIRTCIPAFEGTFGEPFIYKTPHHPDYVNDQQRSFLEIALATSAAPTYLQALTHDPYIFVDGGLVANNPIMVGVVDALACFDINPSQIEVLSLGCGKAPFRLQPKHIFGGKIQWKNAVAAAIDASSSNALGQAYLLAGRDQIFRINPDLPNGPIDMADFSRAERELPPTAEHLFEKVGTEIAERFLKEPAGLSEMPGRTG